jgi:hypothetical protein
MNKVFICLVIILFTVNILQAQSDFTITDIPDSITTKKTVIIHNSQHFVDSSLIVDLPKNTSLELNKAIRKGKKLTTMGIVIHCAGFGIGSMLFTVDNTTISSCLGTIGGAMIIAGPALSCVGASSVDKRFKKNNINIRESYSWKYMSLSGVFSVAGVACALAGLTTMYLSWDNSGGNAAKAFFVSGAGLEILSEALMITCLIQSKVYVYRAEKQVPKISISPILDFKGKIGLAANVAF